jgi:hypothetical protein
MLLLVTRTRSAVPSEDYRLSPLGVVGEQRNKI